MASENLVNLQIDEKMIRGLLEQKIAVAVTASLGGSDNIAAALVERALTAKVDEQGKPCSYSTAKPWMQWMSEKAVQKAAQEALEEFLKEQAPAIRAAVAKQLSKAGPKSVAAGLVAGLIEKCYIVPRIEFSAQVKNEYEMR